MARVYRALNVEETMRAFLHRMHRVVHHPGAQLTVGLLLLASAATELRGAVSAGDGVMEMGMPQGVLALGLYHVLASLAPLFEAVVKSDDALDELRHRHSDHRPPDE